MAAPAILLVGQAGASLCRVLAGKRFDAQRLPPPAEAVGPLRAAGTGAPVRVLVDVVEEEYRLETLPPAGRRDRQALLERRLAAAFDGTPWRLALPLKQDGARGNRALLCALTAPHRIRPWLTALAAAQLSLAGLYSLPLLTATLLPAVGLARGTSALVYRAQRGGLRLCFFVDGALLGSRLLVAEGGATREPLTSWRDALARLRPWLAQAGLWPAEAALDVGLLATGAPLALLRDGLPGLPQTRIHLLDAAALARRLGLIAERDEASEDAVWAQLLLRHQPVRQYATPAERAGWRGERRRRAALAVAGGLCISLGVSTALVTRRGLELGRQAQALAAANQAQHAALVARQRALPGRVLPSATGVALRKFCETLGSPPAAPAAALHWLEPLLETAPDLVWTRLTWQPLEQAADLTLEGEVPAFSGDYIAAMGAIERLIRTLRARPEVASVRLHDAPLPVPGDAATSLRSDGLEGRFTLVISLTVADHEPR